MDFDMKKHGHVYERHLDTFMGYWITVFRFAQLIYLMVLMVLLLIYTTDVLLNRFDLNANELYDEY